MKQPDLGNALARIRKSKGLTQTELSEKCNITVKTIQRIESGKVTPRSYTVKTISQALSVDFFAFSDNSYEAKGGAVSSILQWLQPLMKQVAELFNLKTNTMKKVTLISIVLGAIGFGLFTLIPNGQAQDQHIIDYSKYTEAHSRGVIYFFPKGEGVIISNVKDTADYRIFSDLIQEYQNKIYLNGTMIGRAFNSDTVIYKEGELFIRATYWKFASSNGSRELNCLIPVGIQVDNRWGRFNLGGQIDTTNLKIGEDHIQEFDYKIFLNGDFIGQINPGDTLVYNQGVISFIRIDEH
jgi:transcriptional regulator with XRE-family HTH domain